LIVSFGGISVIVQLVNGGVASSVRTVVCSLYCTPSLNTDAVWMTCDSVAGGWLQGIAFNDFDDFAGQQQMLLLVSNNTCMLVLSVVSAKPPEVPILEVKNSPRWV